MSKTTEHAASVLKKINAEVCEGVFIDYEILPLCDMRTTKETGFVVILTLSAKYDYTSALLDDWRKRLDSSDYWIRVKHNQLIVRFNVRYD